MCVCPSEFVVAALPDGLQGPQRRPCSLCKCRRLLERNSSAPTRAATTVTTSPGP